MTTNEPTAAQVETMTDEVDGLYASNNTGLSNDERRRNGSRAVARHVLRSRAEREGGLERALVQAEKWFVQIAGVSDLALSQFTSEKDYGRDWRQKDAIEAVAEVRATLARYRALDAKPEPTLAEAVEAMLAAVTACGYYEPGTMGDAVRDVKAALARERAKARP